MRQPPVLRLLRWLSSRMAPLGVQNVHLLSGSYVAAAPWYVPAMNGCAIDENGLSARQLAFGGEMQAADPDLVGKILATYANVVGSLNPMRAALGASCSCGTTWHPLRAYLIPYDSNLPAHTAAAQLAIALRDVAGASTVAQGNTFLARTHQHALGILEGKVIGVEGTQEIRAEDLQSLLLSSRLIDADRMRKTMLQLRAKFEEVQSQLEEPELVRDAISILGLLTARNWWYDGTDQLRRENAAETHRLRTLIENEWSKRPTPRKASTQQVHRQSVRVLRAEQELRVLNEAEDVLRSDITDFAKLRTIQDLLVPEVWGMSTFKKRLTARSLRTVLLTPELTEHFHTAFAAARLNVTFKLKESEI